MEFHRVEGNSLKFAADIAKVFRYLRASNIDCKYVAWDERHCGSSKIDSSNSRDSMLVGTDVSFDVDFFPIFPLLLCTRYFVLVIRNRVSAEKKNAKQKQPPRGDRPSVARLKRIRTTRNASSEQCSRVG